MAYYSYGQPAPYSRQTYPPSLPLSSNPTQMSTSPPGQMDTGGYLPAFLLGSPAPKSPQRVRAGTFQSSAGATSSGYPGLSTSSTAAGVTGGGRGTSFLERGGRGTSFMERPHAGVTAGPKMNAPPVQGLYDHPSSPAHRTSTPLLPVSPERRQLSFSTAGRGGPVFGTPAHLGLHTPGTTLDGFGAPVSGVVRRTPPSPAQMDPFYSQGERLTSEDDYPDCWITIFGFPPSASSYILEQFSQYGTILKHKVSSNGNWMHILYQSRLQAKKALSKNGKVYGNGIMVGVQLCIDKGVMEDESTMPAPPTMSDAGHTSSSGVKSPSIRPLTAAYQASSSVHQVVPSNPNAPQKSTGFVSKALEYMFGW